MKKEAILVKAFTKNPKEGNPAGVVFEADDLSKVEKQEIASTLGFSESAFVSHSDKADFKVEFFSPKVQVPMCGHATIATFHALVEHGYLGIKVDSTVSTQETLAGIVSVECRNNGLITMTQQDPQFLGTDYDLETIANLLSIDSSSLSSETPIELVSTGTPKLMIPVKTLEGLFQIKPKLKAISNFCEQSNVRGFYPFTTETQNDEADFHARQFNPLAGIDEDPLTGIAAGALGAYVVKHQIKADSSFVIEQGYFMEMGGNIYVDIGEEVKVGGYAVEFGVKK